MRRLFGPLAAWLCLLLAAGLLLSAVQVSADTDSDSMATTVEPVMDEASQVAEPVPKSDSEYHQYIVVGAGPGGLQMAAHLQAQGRDFVLLEASPNVGSFFRSFPRHGQLISINKRFTGRSDDEFNMRHDWNSLLPGRDGDTACPRMRDFSKRFFPEREEYVAYLEAYVAHHGGLNIQFDRRVVWVTKEDTWAGTGPNKEPLFHLEDSTGKKWSCHILVWATAQGRPYVPKETPGMELAIGYEDLEDPREDPEGWEARHANKRILVLGLGNSAFETAAAFSPVAAYVNVLGRSKGGLRQAYNTHYVGDLRVVNDHILDTFFLKSMDTLDLGFDIREGRLEKNETTGRIHLRFPGDKENANYREGYDLVVRALGWRFDDSPFDPKTVPVEVSASGKFPVQTIDYESISTPNLFFAGNLQHFQDFKESAGGFIHGFRYLVRNVARRVGQRYHGDSLFRTEEPEIPATPQGIADALLQRIQRASGPYQMFGQLADLLIWDQKFGDGTKADYVEEVVLAGVEQQASHPDTLVWSWHFDYGKALDGRADNSIVVLHPGQAHRSQFLHPIIRFYRPAGKDGMFSQRAEFHIMEDFLVGWDVERLHRAPLVEFVERCIAGNYTDQAELLERRVAQIQSELTEEQRLRGARIVDPFYGEFRFEGTQPAEADPILGKLKAPNSEMGRLEIVEEITAQGQAGSGSQGEVKAMPVKQDL